MLNSGTDFLFELTDVEGGGKPIKGSCRRTPKGIEIRFEGFSTAREVRKEGAPVLIENNDGTPVINIWGDIDQEDPTDVISLWNAHDWSTKNLAASKDYLRLAPFLRLCAISKISKNCFVILHKSEGEDTPYLSYWYGDGWHVDIDLGHHCTRRSEIEDCFDFYYRCLDRLETIEVNFEQEPYSIQRLAKPEDVQIIKDESVNWIDLVEEGEE